MDEEKKKLLVNWLASSILLVAIFLLYFLLRKDYSLRGTGDSFLVAGAIVLAFPILGLIGRTGLFDIFSYSFLRLGESFRRENTKRFETAYDYKNYKKEKRSERPPFYLPYFIIGGVAIAIGIVLSLVSDSAH